MKSRPPTEKKNAKKKTQLNVFFACRVSAPRLNHEMAYNAGREVPIPPLNPYNIIKAKRGDVSQSMDLYRGFHRDEVSHKLSRRVPINRHLLRILKSSIKVYGPGLFNGPLSGISSGRGFPQAVPKRVPINRPLFTNLKRGNNFFAFFFSVGGCHFCDCFPNEANHQRQGVSSL